MATTPIQVTVENLSDPGGLALTPVWLGFHNGGFEVGRAGAAASDFGGLEELAEEGNTTPLSTRFQNTSPTWVDTVLTAPGGFSGAPVFEPGESVTQTINVTDAELNRYLSYASMVIPSNDAFVANFDPTAYPIFDTSGNLLGTTTIVIYGRNIWDAGTEVNNPAGGAAFSTEGGAAVAENGTIHLHTGLDDFLGTGLPTGENLAAAFIEQTPVARITITSNSTPVGPADTAAPEATLQASDLTSAAASHSVQVVYSDPSGVDISSIDPSDLRVDGGNGQFAVVTGVTTDATPGTNPRSVTATYTLAPGTLNAFGFGENGNYRVTLENDAVRDIRGHSLSNQLLGAFNVDVGFDLEITLENLSPLGGLGQTPFWVGFHDGSFEIGRSGEAASAFGGLEELAEDGDAGPLANRFDTAQPQGVDATVTAPGGFSGAPVFEPGETVTHPLSVTDPHQNRYFSFASMVIPSNDAFVANLNSRAYALFDSLGQFQGPRTIEIYGRHVYDAGTEVNNPSGGAAFSTEGGTAVDENGVLQVHVGLDDFIGTGLPTGENLLSAFDPNTPLARITIAQAGSNTAPIDTATPEAVLDADPVTTSGAATSTFQITYTDPSGVDTSRIGVDDLRLESTRGRFLRVTGVTTDAAQGTHPRTVTATYTIEAADGPFTFEDNGFYRVYLQNRSLRDMAGNINAEAIVGEVEVRVGVKLKVTVENLSESGGLAQTPFWVGIHDGSFEIGESGQAASNFAGLEELAEEGDVAPLADRFANEASSGVDIVLTAPGGFAGAPVFEPGEVVSQVMDVTDPDQNRFLELRQHGHSF